MDKMRGEFEEWAKQNFELDVESWGEYVSAATHWAWLAWKASRESLTVEIPKEGEASSFSNCVVFDTDAVKEMLDKVGVKYE